MKRQKRPFFPMVPSISRRKLAALELGPQARDFFRVDDELLFHRFGAFLLKNRGGTALSRVRRGGTRSPTPYSNFILCRGDTLFIGVQKLPLGGENMEAQQEAHWSRRGRNLHKDVFTKTVPLRGTTSRRQVTTVAKIERESCHHYRRCRLLGK